MTPGTPDAPPARPQAEAQPEWGSADRATLVAWLDATLRPGAAVSTGSDLPLLLDGSDAVSRRTLVADGVPVAHAAARELAVTLPSGLLRVGVIGAVATSARHRKRGLGSRVVRGIEEDLVARGVPLAMLWADVPGFYEKLGYVLAGREAIFHCPRKKRRPPRGLAVRPADAADLAGVAALHERERCFAGRDAPTWSALFGMPGTDFYVLEREGRVAAYGVVGKGHDLEGCLHEWGGDEILLPVLLSGVFALRPERELWVMSPPWKHQAARAMAFQGFVPSAGALGMMKVLDRRTLLETLGLDATPGLPEDHDALVRTVFGYPAGPDASEDGGLPVPLYLFGLDST